MKTMNKIQTAAAGLVVLLALSGCGGAATGTSGADIP
ncbi:ABC-type glycerol-3-phosphate transport system substrate-binding protein, partial [Arthrobacter oryzae]|nr:ABC-type glycerol-3-phosphate transport system substrate-binding protein [Arthrobacter oryzae]